MKYKIATNKRINCKGMGQMMKKNKGSRIWTFALLPVLTAHGLISSAKADPASGETNQILLIELAGQAQVMPPGASEWVYTQTNQPLSAFSHFRTLKDSRATLQWSDQSVVQLTALTEIEILPPSSTKSESGLHILRGIFSFFHRDTPGRIRIVTQGAIAGIEGTEFVLSEDGTGSGEHTTISVIDGKVSLNGTNSAAGVTLTNGEQAVVTGGGQPVRTAGFIANNLLQWCLYYPAILDWNELGLSTDEAKTLDASLAAYRSGDLLAALAQFPAAEPPGSDASRIYHAALLLSVGQVDEAENLLTKIAPGDASSRLPQLADALRELVAAVKRQPNPSRSKPLLATQLLAASYFEQSIFTNAGKLEKALADAKQAVAVSPEFGFGWERVAELEFSFGRTSQALEALNKSLALSPRNAQAFALKGFLLAAQNHPAPAIAWFDRALALDGALGNAWLGRGLCRIRQGYGKAGRADLLVAAALEPQRSALRSYLGKGFADAGDWRRAEHELFLAEKLDEADPTPWLYSALLAQQDNQVNQGIENLQKSQELNDNRSVYRSGLLLDQDSAVRSANLANLYNDAGMKDVSVAEAAKGVAHDYASGASHLFLSDSFNELRDPTQFNLRYETVWFNELLLANLFSPVGGGRLSQNLSSQEYSKLFQSDGLTYADSTGYRTDGQFQEQASVSGTRGNTSFSLDVDYAHNSGFRVNNDLENLDWFATIKQQVTPQDTAMVIVEYEDYHSGDNFQYFDNSEARPNYRFSEQAQPNAVGFWHHEWAPGIHTLAMAGRLVTDQHFSDLGPSQLVLWQSPPGQDVLVDSSPFDVAYDNKIEIYTGELNQVLQWERLALSAGARYQSGTFEAQDTLTNPGKSFFFSPFTGFTDGIDSAFRRVTGYGYATIEPVDNLWLTGGVAYDHENYPYNFRAPPLTPGQDSRSQIGPKAALIWSPLKEITVRGAYTRSLGGASLDESFRLEPTQLAGFPQAFRSLISESVVGSLTAPAYTTYGAALDLKLADRTFVELTAMQLEADIHQEVGSFDLENFTPPALPSSTPQQLNYRERVFKLSINQLIGSDFVIGADYAITESRLNETLTDAAPLDGSSAAERALLNQAGGYLLFNHRSGFFAQFDAQWYHQDNYGDLSSFDVGPTSDFAQENLQAGWRFYQRRLQIQAGILNLSGGDYHLNPLNVMAEMPHKRVFEAQLKFEF